MTGAAKAILVTGFIALSSPAIAQSGEELAKSKGCLKCHAIDQKKLGPAFRDIAAANKGNKAAEERLVAALKLGKGHVKVRASDGELKALVEYVLSR